MLTLEQTGRAAGSARWCELALWGALSRWATDADDAAAAVLWDSHAAHAAWRAGQWWGRLPLLAVVDRDLLVAAPNPGWEALADDLAGLSGTLARMAGAYRVALPRLAASYAELGSATSSVTDAPLRRTLAQAESDVTADWRTGTFSLLQRLTDVGSVEEAAATCSAIERRALGHPAGEAAQG